MFPFPLFRIPILSDLISYYQDAIDNLNLWVGTHLLKISSFEKIELPGSGDTTFDYVRLVTNLLLAITLSLILAIIFHTRNNYHKVYSYLMIYARYYIGLYMISYGLAKLATNGQFSFPEIYRLDQRYGDSSPMGLLWTFMGYSKAYCVFAGIGEILGGVLLLFRKTIVAGCLLSIVVLMNVVMMNFCYDVPVKIFSSHLLIITIIILLPYLSSLYSFFFSNEVSKINLPKLNLPTRWMRITRIIVKSIFVAGLLLLTILMEFSYDESEYNSKKSNLEGRYKIMSFEISSNPHQCVCDTVQWKKMNIKNEYARIGTMNDSSTLYKIHVDSLENKFVLNNDLDSTLSYTLNYKDKTDTTLTVFGLYKNDQIVVSLKKKQKSDYELVNRGFHWINEYPPNW